MVLVAQLAHGLRPVVDMIYPPRCPSCGVAVFGEQGLCHECWDTLDVLGDTVGEGADVPVFAATRYNDTSRRLVLAYKHGGRIALSRLLARLMAARLHDVPAGALPSILVPVPLHRWRLWQRGFNQAALLAQELERMGKGTALVDGLIRCKRTPSLGGLGREARERALSGAIIVNPARMAWLAGRNVVLIDDVFTSGATSRACLAAINKARPASMAIACFAQVGEGAAEQGWKT
jgi:ComF family protein